MVKLLEKTDVNPVDEEVDGVMTAAEAEAAMKQFASTGTPGDLSDGGVVNGVKITPMSGWGGKPLEKGRPAAREAWMHDGTWTLLPLAWNPDGTRHDGARPYLQKRHCNCCNAGGFRGVQCPNCVKNSCSRCNHRNIIAAFYLDKDKVPNQARFYGDVNCFLPTCVRQKDRGFKTEVDMRMHARSRHRMEYQAHTETLNSGKADEVADLRKRLDDLMLAQSGRAAPQAVVVPTAIRPKRSHKRRWTEEQKEAARARYRAAQEPVAGAAT